MSFFGFDTTLPRDRGRGPGAPKGFFEYSDPFAQVALADKFVDGDA
jgi:DNA topoisomerase 2-associated protein PAT1